MSNAIRDSRDHALDAEDCSNHCPRWFVLSILLAALACVIAASFVG